METEMEARKPDLGQVEAHWKVIWQPHLETWPTGALLALSGPATGWAARGHRVPVGALEAILEAVAAWPEAANLYAAVAPEPAERLKAPGRTSRASALPLPALVADVDVAGPGHAHSEGDPLPNSDEALEAIGRVGELLPLLVVDTGGGFHVWCPLESPLDHRAKGGRELLATWKQAWLRVFADAGRYVDPGPLADPARVLRLAGTFRTKPGAPEPLPVTLLEAPTSRASEALLAAVLPTLAAKPATSRKRRRVVDDAPPKHLAATEAPTPPAKPMGNIGTAFSRAVPVSALLEAAGWTRVTDDGDGRATWAANDSDDHAAAVQAATYVDDDGIERVTVFSDSTCQRLGIAKAGQHSLRSWEWLVTVVHRGDRAAAEADAMAQLGGDAKLPEKADDNAGAKLWVARNVFADVRRPSLWAVERYEDEDGEIKDRFVQLTDWLPVTQGVHRRVRLDNSGHLSQVAAQTSYDLAVVDQSGHLWAANRVAHDKGDSPRVLLQLTAAPCLLPVSRTEVGHLENVLRVTRKTAEVSLEWESRGWAWVSDHWAFVAPGGSVTADGPGPKCAVVGPGAGDLDGLNSHQRAVGWPEAPALNDLTEKDFTPLKDFLALLPGRQDLTTAIVGALFAAPLAMPRRTTLVVHGKHGGGKSVLLRCAKAFTSPLRDDVFDLSVRTVSPARATQGLAMARDCAVFCDDFRQSEDNQAENLRMAAVFDAISTLGYGAQAAERATADGSMRATPSARTLPIVTAETLPTNASVVDRLAICAPVGPDDIPRGPGNKIDPWQQTHFPAARRLFGGYVRWLATGLDAAGEDALDKLAQAADGHRMRIYQATGNDRAAEAVAVLEVGWLFLRKFARKAGLEECLPDKAFVAAQLDRVRAATRGQHTDGDTPAQLLAAIRGALESGQAYLTDASGDSAPTDPGRWGWVPDGRGDMRPAGRPIGRLCLGGKHILVSDGGAQYVAAQSRLRGLAAEQVRAAMASIAGAPSARAPRQLVPSQARGWLVPADVCDGLPDPPTFVQSQPSPEVEGPISPPPGDATEQPGPVSQAPAATDAAAGYPSPAAAPTGSGAAGHHSPAAPAPDLSTTGALVAGADEEEIVL